MGPRRNSGYSRPTAHNTDPLSKDLDTNELRDKFRMVMDSLEQPSSHRSAASSRTDLHSDSQVGEVFDVLYLFFNVFEAAPMAEW